MVYSFEHPAVERQALREMDAFRERTSFAATRATPDLADRIAEMSRVWPDIPPGVLMGMAMAGVDPYSDIAQQVEQAAVSNAEGLGFHEPGEVVNSRQMEQEVGGQDNPLFSGLKAGVRGAFMGMTSAYDEVTRRATSGLVAMQDPDRTYAQAMELSTPSQAALLATDEFEWKDLGEGFIPGGQVRERQEELKQRLTLDGHWMSPGRALARTVTEPGTKPFNFVSGLLDAAGAIVLDPSTYALAGAGKLRAASKVFATDNALIRGLRNTTDEKFAREWWLASPVGQRLRGQLLDEGDPYEVWRRLGGAQGKVDRETSRLIADAKTSEALDKVVLPRLGPQGIAEKPVGMAASRGVGRLFGDDLGAVHGMGIHLRRAAENVRTLQWMPDQTINIADPDRAMITVDRFLKGVKADPDDHRRVMDMALRVGEEQVAEGWMDVAHDLTSLAAKRAMRDSVGARTGPKAVKLEQQIAKGLGRAFQDRTSELTKYFTAEAGRPRGHMPTLVGGREVDYSQVPHLVSEYLGRNIPLPDMQTVRRNIGGYAKFMRLTHDLPRPVWEGAVDFASGFMTTIWKPMVLLRGAYIARVVGEEQARMAAAGLDSAFRHPLSFLAYQTGRRGGTGVTGDVIGDMKEFQAIAQRKGGGWIGRKPGSIGTDDWILYERGKRGLTDQEFARAWADDFGLLVNDEVSGVVARMGPTEAKSYLATAKGRKMRMQVAEAEHNREVATSTRALDDYVDSVWLRIEEKTRGNSDMIEAIATGKLDGKVVRWAGGKAQEATALQKGLLRRLDEVGITEVKGQRFVTTSRRSSGDHALLDRFNHAIDIGADIIMSKPTNKMSRFPTWQQAYVKAVESTLGFADAPTQRAIIGWAKDNANLSRSQVRRMEATARAGQGTVIRELDGVDLLARSVATRDTRRLLYDLTEHGQFSDLARASMPFAEAWKEIMLSWSRIVRDRPHVLRRGQQAIEGARGAGWFHTDPSTGEEMFTYPGGNLVSRALLGGFADNPAVQGALAIPGVGAAATVGLGVAGAFMDEQPAEFDMRGRAAGLNLFAGSVIPGIGPVVSIPAAAVMPDRPSWDWVRDKMFPFGDPDTSGGIAGAFMPAWMQKFRTAWFKDPDTDRAYANSVFDVARALVANGEGSTDSPEAVNTLMAVAKERAKGLWLVRGASQFVAPTGPEVAFRVKDLDGSWWPFQVVASEYHRMRQESGEQPAIDEFLATFGTDLISLLQSKSRAIVQRPMSEVGDDWIRANPDLVESYPLTVGLISPDDPAGEFSFDAHRRAFEEGTREQLTPQQMVWSSNSTLGNLAYAHQVERIGDGQDLDSRRARAAVRSQLTERFPGFNSHLGVKPRPRTEHQVAELERMASDDRLSGPAIEGLRAYLEARGQAMSWVSAFAGRSTTFGSSNETAWIRTWLRTRATEITQQFPEFLPLWERALSHELADEDEPIEPGEMGG